MPTYRNPPIPAAPGAYNYWQGNQFMIPPLGQYARPGYAEAIADLTTQDPTLATALPGAVPPGMMAPDRDRAERAGMAPSRPGEGMNAVTTNAWDLFPTSPVAAFASIPAQAVMNALAGQPDRTISRVGLGGLFDAGRNLLGGGGELAGAIPAGIPGYGAYAPEQTYQEPDFSGIGTPVDPGDVGQGMAGDLSQPDFSAGYYRMGGMIPNKGDKRHLAPVPIMAHENEFVMRPEAVRKHGKGLLDDMNEGKVEVVRKKGKRKGLLD